MLETSGSEACIYSWGALPFTVLTLTNLSQSLMSLESSNRHHDATDGDCVFLEYCSTNYQNSVRSLCDYGKLHISQGCRQYHGVIQHQPTSTWLSHIPSPSRVLGLLFSLLDKNSQSR
jgi:hypothetical protein